MSDPGPILCLGTTPAVQRVMVFRRLLLDTVNRAVTTLDGAAGKSINVAPYVERHGSGQCRSASTCEEQNATKEDQPRPPFEWALPGIDAGSPAASAKPGHVVGTTS